MLSIAGGSLAFFAVVWAAVCVLAGAVVTDAMLRGAAGATAAEAEFQGDATEA